LTSMNPVNDEERAYLEQIWKVWQEWQAAQNYFENASDPDAVEFAVYNMEAKRRQFTYMMKVAREKMKIDAESLIMLQGFRQKG